RRLDGRISEELERICLKALRKQPEERFRTAQDMADVLWDAQGAEGTGGKRAAAGPGRLSNVPELPPHFLPRPAQLRTLKAAVLAEGRNPVALTGTARVGLQGMGGIGKSVLAAALARDEEVRRAFADGVFWVTVGQGPSLTALQQLLACDLG